MPAPLDRVTLTGAIRRIGTAHAMIDFAKIRWIRGRSDSLRVFRLDQLAHVAVIVGGTLGSHNPEAEEDSGVKGSGRLIGLLEWTIAPILISMT